MLEISKIQSCVTGLPWHSGWEPACQYRRHRFDHWSGKIPHAVEQLSSCATTTEPASLQPVLRITEPEHHKEEKPRSPQLEKESPSKAMKTQHGQKNKKVTDVQVPLTSQILPGRWVEKEEERSQRAKHHTASLEKVQAHI